MSNKKDEEDNNDSTTSPPPTPTSVTAQPTTPAATPPTTSTTQAPSTPPTATPEGGEDTVTVFIPTSDTFMVGGSDGNNSETSGEVFGSLDYLLIQSGPIVSSSSNNKRNDENNQDEELELLLLQPTTTYSLLAFDISDLPTKITEHAILQLTYYDNETSSVLDSVLPSSDSIIQVTLLSTTTNQQQGQEEEGNDNSLSLLEELNSQQFDIQQYLLSSSSQEDSTVTYEIDGPTKVKNTKMHIDITSLFKLHIQMTQQEQGSGNDDGAESEGRKQQRLLWQGRKSQRILFPSNGDEFFIMLTHKAASAGNNSTTQIDTTRFWSRQGTNEEYHPKLFVQTTTTETETTPSPTSTTSSSSPVVVVPSASPTTSEIIITPPDDDDTDSPTPGPTSSPIVDPTTPEPSSPQRTDAPSVSPTTSPPVVDPTPEPSPQPTLAPSVSPTSTPVVDPTPEPSPQPTLAPSISPTPAPVVDPTPEPSTEPTPSPTLAPSAEPTPSPVPDPTPEPSPEPTQPPPTLEPSPPPTPTPPTDQPTTAMIPDDGGSDIDEDSCVQATYISPLSYIKVAPSNEQLTNPFFFMDTPVQWYVLTPQRNMLLQSFDLYLVETRMRLVIHYQEGDTSQTTGTWTDVFDDDVNGRGIDLTIGQGRTTSVSFPAILLQAGVTYSFHFATSTAGTSPTVNSFIYGMHTQGGDDARGPNSLDPDFLFPHGQQITPIPYDPTDVEGLRFIGPDNKLIKTESFVGDFLFSNPYDYISQRRLLGNINYCLSPDDVPAAAPTTDRYISPSCDPAVADTKPFSICLEVIGTVRPLDLYAYEEAVDYWEALLVNNGGFSSETTALPDEFFESLCNNPRASYETEPSAAAGNYNIWLCGSTPTFDADSTVLGSGGPVFFNLVATEPTRTGKIEINQNQFAVSLRTMIHEIGHVLGIGTQWRRTDMPQLAIDTGNLPDYCEYLEDSEATLAFQILSGYANANGNTQRNCASRPRTQAFSSGCGGHWQEDCLGNALMSPVAVNGVGITSAITIGALKDLGYEIISDTSQAFRSRVSFNPDDVHGVCKCPPESGRRTMLPLESSGPSEEMIEKVNAETKARHGGSSLPISIGVTLVGNGSEQSLVVHL